MGINKKQISSLKTLGATQNQDNILEVLLLMPYFDAMFGVEISSAQAGIQVIAKTLQGLNCRQQLTFILKKKKKVKKRHFTNQYFTIALKQKNPALFNYYKVIQIPCSCQWREECFALGF